MSEALIDKSDLIPVDSVRALVKRGYRPIIVALLAEGLQSDEISSVLAEEYGIYVEPRVIAYSIKRFDKNGAIPKFTAQQVANLAQISLEKIEFHKAEYAKAHEAKNDKLMRHHEDALLAWMGHGSKLFIKQGASIEIQQTNVSVEAGTINIGSLIDKLADKPELIDVIAKLKEEEGD